MHAFTALCVTCIVCAASRLTFLLIMSRAFPASALLQSVLSGLCVTADLDPQPLHLCNAFLLWDLFRSFTGSFPRVCGFRCFHQASVILCDQESMCISSCCFGLASQRGSCRVRGSLSHIAIQETCARDSPLGGWGDVQPPRPGALTRLATELVATGLLLLLASYGEVTHSSCLLVVFFFLLLICVYGLCLFIVAVWVVFLLIYTPFTFL